MKDILYLSAHPFADRSAFSGTNRRIFDALQGIPGFRVEYFQAKPNPIVRFLVRSMGFLYRKVFRKDYQTGLEEKLFHSRCRAVMKKLNQKHYDALICWQLCFGEVFSKFQGRKIFFSDSTYHAIVPYYQWKVSDKQFRIIDLSQKKLLDGCDYFWSFSSFFIEDAANHYGINTDKIVPMLFFPTVCSDGYKEKKNESLSLLFIGTNYRDKGTRIAIDALIELRDKYGVNAELKVVGVSNEEQLSVIGVDFLGRVSQFDDKKRFASLFEEADIFILPTHHECAGIVFAEAASFGVPAVSYRTGGVPDYVADGVSGYLLEPGSTASDFARIIVDRLATEEQRQTIGRQAFSRYESLMSRDVFVLKAKASLDALFANEVEE